MAEKKKSYTVRINTNTPKGKVAHQMLTASAMSRQASQLVIDALYFCYLRKTGKTDEHLLIPRLEYSGEQKKKHENRFSISIGNSTRKEIVARKLLEQAATARSVPQSVATALYIYYKHIFVENKMPELQQDTPTNAKIVAPVPVVQSTKSQSDTSEKRRASNIRASLAALG